MNKILKAIEKVFNSQVKKSDINLSEQGFYEMVKVLFCGKNNDMIVECMNEHAEFEVGLINSRFREVTKENEPTDIGSSLELSNLDNGKKLVYVLNFCIELDTEKDKQFDNMKEELTEFYYRGAMLKSKFINLSLRENDMILKKDDVIYIVIQNGISKYYLDDKENFNLVVDENTIPCKLFYRNKDNNVIGLRMY